MPDIYLDLLRNDFVSDLNVPVSAWRGHADVLFTNATGGLRTSFSCIVDTGAPFSVLPFSLWQSRGVQWKPLGQQLTRQGRPAPEALKWQGVDCSLGVTHVHLIDLRTRTITNHPLLVVAKFANQRSQNLHLELVAVLGMNILADNQLRLEMDGTGADLAGYLSIP